MPYWLVGLWISIVAAIYGIKATDIIKTRENGTKLKRNLEHFWSFIKNLFV